MNKLAVSLFLLLPVFSVAQDIRHVADSIRLRRRVPALAYAIVSADSIYNMGAVGYRRLRTKDTVKINNRFHMGSATITLTSFIAAQLVDKGKIKWNTSLFTLFPELK